MNKCRLAIVISHPIQHFAPLYEELNKADEIELKVFFIAENGTREYPDRQFGQTVKWDIPLLQGYPHEFVEPGKIIGKFNFFSVDSRRISSAVEAFEPDVVWIHGYGQLASWRVLLARPNNCKFIYSSDSNLDGRRVGWHLFLKNFLIRFFLKRCHYFLSISPANRLYLTYYGVAEDAIADTSFPIDIERLNKNREDLSDAEVSDCREQLGFSAQQTVVLFAGKLVNHKRPQDILYALEVLPDDCVALVVGSGEMASDLQKLAKELGIQERIYFTGFVNQSQLALYFSVADIFVFPSEREPYGAIAAEVLPFGLPIVASSTVGAIGASIIENQNAIVFPAGDYHQMAEGIKQLSRDASVYNEFSRASLSLAAKQNKTIMARDIILFCS